jgi:hypothetical protein
MAATQWYVNYESGSDTTGNGTSGNPYKTVKKLLETQTHDATNGNEIIMSGNADEVLVEALDTTFTNNSWYPTNQLDQVVIRGTAGSTTGFDGNATYSTAVNNSYLHFINLEIKDSGTSAYHINSGRYYYCTIHNGNAVSTTYGLGSGFFNNCYIYDLAGSSGVGAFPVFEGCIVNMKNWTSGSTNFYVVHARNSAFLMPGDYGLRFLGNSDHGVVSNSTIYYASGTHSTARVGLKRASTSREFQDYNQNLIVFGHTVTGDIGIQTDNEARTCRSNLVYADTAFDVSYSGAFFDNQELYSNPFSTEPTGANDWSEWEPDLIAQTKVKSANMDYPHVIPRYAGAWQPTSTAAHKHPLGRF